MEEKIIKTYLKSHNNNTMAQSKGVTQRIYS